MTNAGTFHLRIAPRVALFTKNLNVELLELWEDVGLIV